MGLEIIVNPTQTIGLRLSVLASRHNVITKTHEAMIPASPTNKAMVSCGNGGEESLLLTRMKAVASHETMTVKLIVRNVNNLLSFSVSKAFS